MINIAIVDDDTNFCTILKNKLQEYDQDLIIEIYQNPYDFLEKIHNFKYVLLDIELPQINGIALSKQLRSNNISIFFITVHKELMIRAFGKNVEGFILKDNLNLGIKSFLDFVKLHRDEKYIKINIDYKLVKIYFDEILYIHYSLRDVEFHLISSNNIIKKNINLKDIITVLDDDFIRIDRNTIVNINYIDTYKNGSVYIRNEKLNVSRRRKKEVKMRFFDWRLNHG